jgi:nitronate monooxygenase
VSPDRPTDLFASASPIVAAPMAGGATTPSLVAAVTGAGGFAFLPAGYRSAAAFTGDLAAVRALGVEEFGVNLFVPQRSGITAAAFADYARRLQPEAARFGVELSTDLPPDEDDDWEAKLDLLVADPVPWVSVTFGAAWCRGGRAAAQGG